MQTDSTVPAPDVVAAVREHATTGPAHPALRAGARTVTYAELDSWSEVVAGRLAARPDATGLVAVVADRSVEFVVAVLALLKAGCAYLPIDPAYPQERQTYLLTDSRVRLAVCADPAGVDLPDGVGHVPLAALTAITPDEPGAAPLPLFPVAPPSAPAYVIYTSGSTGLPKGVRVTRGNLAGLVAAQRSAFGVRADDRVLQFASPSFDASVSEIFTTLGAGATLCLGAPGTGRDPESTAALLTADRVTLATLPPSLLRVLDPARLPDLRTVVSAGERCGADVVARWAGDRVLINAYGPTETTVCATSHVCVPDGQAGDPPIGTAIDGVRVHVLDEGLRPVGDGAPGELYIGGDGVAAGYHDRPRLTGERFLPDPFATGRGARMYRTGDLVRQRPDGALDFLGRIDRQLKIRGYRIEPGEVEAVAETLTGVRAAAVRAWPGPDGDRRLVAHVVTDGTTTGAAVLAALRAALPAHLCPDQVIELAELPLTRNGKIDYPALPEPVRAAGAGELSGPVEHALAAALAEILELDAVGPDDDFFTLGCHSLMATRVVNRVRTALGVDIPLRTFLQARTVRATARRLAAQAPAAAGTTAGITAGPRPAVLPASYAQQQLWALAQSGVADTAYTTPAAVRVHGPIRVDLLRAAVADVIARHEALRTSFVLAGGELTQVVHDGSAPVPLTVLDLRGLAVDERERRLAAVAHAEARTPFDLERPPLLRVSLVALADAEHVLIVTAHHIVADGWSQSIFARELTACYAAREHGGAPDLPPLPVQYPDYALWQRHHLDDDRITAERSWWRQHLAGAPNGTELPPDSPRPRLRTFDGAMAPFDLPAALVDGLTRLAGRHGATLHMVLAAGVTALLHRWTRQDDVLIGTISAGRGDVAVEPLIGYFVNALVLRTAMGDDPPFTRLVERVRDTTLQVHAHQDLPFDLVVDAAGHRHDPGRSPLFQVALVVQNLPDVEAAAVSPFSVEPVAVDPGTSKCDLSVVVATGAGGATGHIEYNTALFRLETIDRWTAHLVALLTSACAAPDTAVTALRLTDDAHRTAPATDRQVDAPAAAPGLAELVAHQVAARPEAVAVTAGDATVTYAELGRRSDALAGHLHRLGVRRGDLVGVHVGRTSALPTVLLGVLKAGATHLPLGDADDPVPGTASLLADPRTRAVIVDAATADRLTGAPVPVVRVDEVPETGGPGPAEPADDGRDDVVVCLAVDSDGTRVPLTHRGVVALCTAMTEPFGLDEDDAWTLAHDSATGLAAWEMWSALVHGARLVVVPDATLASGDALLDIVCAEGVTVLTVTPAQFRVLDEADAGNGRSTPLLLRHLLLAGGPLDPQVVADWLALRGHHAPPTHLYTTTGATVVAAYRTVTDADLDRGARLPLGTPRAGVRLLLLDQRRQPAPAGMPGEVYVSGADVSGTPHRTGDLARLRADGTLEHLGRVADRVLVAGSVVDVDEARAAAVRRLRVGDAVVAVEGTAGDARLVCHVLARPGLDVAAARRTLAQSLSAHLVPARIVAHDGWPLDRHGVPDRTRLLAGPTTAAVAPAEPVTAWQPEGVAATLLSIWTEVLALDYPLGPDDNFLDLGGDSIQAVRIVAAARQHDIDVSIEDLFLGLTMRELAARAETTVPTSAVPASGPPTIPAFPDAAAGPSAPAAVVAMAPDAEDVFPAADLQAGMLYQSSRSPGEGRHHTVASFRLGLRWEPEAFRAAVRAAGDRHPVLRARFLEHAHDTYVVVERDARIPVAEVDLRGLDDTARDGAVEHWLGHERSTPFPPDAAPLVRVRVLVLAEGEIWFTIAAHHAIMDGWSNATLLTELFGDYVQRCGEPAPAPVPAAPRSTFAEFVAAERAVVADDAAREHWLATLDGAPPTRIGGDTAEAADRFAYEHQVDLPAPVGAGLGALAADLGVPLRTVLLTAHAAAIALYQGEHEVVTGAVTNGRLERLDGDRVLGLFLNTVPIRADLGDGDWRRAVRSVAEVDRAAQHHRRYPLARMARAASLFDTAFNFTHFRIYNQLRELPCLRVLEVRDHQRPDQAVVANFSVDLDSGGLLLRLDSDPGQVDRQRVHTLAAVYRHVLTAMATDPQQPWRAAGTRPAAEYARVRADRTGPTEDLLVTSVPAQWRRQVAATPDAVALVDSAATVTYRELGAAVDRVTVALRRHGVVDGDVVGLLAPRGTASVAAALAVLGVGAVVLPLDPHTPPARLAATVGAAAPRLVLTAAPRLVLTAAPRLGHTAAAVPTLPPTVAVLELDPALPVLPAGGGTHPGPVADVALDAPAFLLTTSGSSGVPKGVLLPHRALCNRLSWMWRRHPFAAGERMAHKTATVFVDSLTEIFGGLLRGVPTVVVPDDAVHDPALLVAELARTEASRILLVPSLLRVLLERHPDLGDRLPRLRWWLLTGEPLTPALLARFRGAVPDGRLLNMYGSTEVTDVTWAELTGPGRAVTVGTPLDNTCVLVLDAARRPVRTGVAGRIHIAGHALALGYHGDPERTAADFRVPTPVLPAGIPLFDTKDRGRLLADGSLDLLGREDGGLKVNGHRLDPMEIEAALRTVPGVRDAAVALRVVGGADALVAYLVADPLPTTHEMRSVVRAVLPDAAVPQVAIAVERLPRTPSGKVDRTALPAAVPEQATAADGPIDGVVDDALAATLLGVCRDVLGRPALGPHDNVMDHGANSLLVMRIAAGATLALGVDVSVVQVFRTPTAAGLAASLTGPDAARATPASTVPVSVSDTPDRGYDAPVAFTQERLWFLDQLDPGNPAYNVTAALRLTGVVDPDAMVAALAALADRHDVLRAGFPTVDERPVQRVRPAGTAGLVPLQVVDLRTHPDPDAQAQERLRAFAELPFDLAGGPLLRAVLLRTAQQVTVFGLALHHAVCDGWSLDVIARDLVALYVRATGGPAPELAPVPVQFPDRAAWERGAAQAEARAAGLRHWVETFTPPPPALRLPTDRPRGAVTTMRGDVLRGAVPAATVAALSELGRAHDATLFMTLLACFAGTVRRWTDEPDLVVGVPVANRGPGLDDVVGFFANTLALRLSLPGATRFGEFLDQTREVTLGAYAHQDTPFEQLVDRLDIARDTSGNPLFQIMFELEDDRGELLRSPGLEVEALILPTRTAKFDLTMHVHRTADGGLDLLLEYSSELFDRTTVARWMRQYQHVLEVAATLDGCRLDGLPIHTPKQEDELLRRGVGATRAWPRGSYAHLFARQVARRGDALACTDGREALSYAELDRRSAAVAARLRAAGAGPGTLVALSSPRGTGLVALVVGVLRTGAAFLPVDPALPRARRAEVLARCSPVAVAGAGAGVDAALAAVGTDVPVVDCSGACGEPGPDPAPAGAATDGAATDGVAADDADVRPSDLAYVLFTSGSTGVPKGVMVDQRGMLNHVHAMVAALGCGPGDVLAQSAAQSFDIAVWQMLTPLVHGGVVRVVGDDTARDPEAFAALLAGEPIHVVEVVPAVLQGMLDAFAQSGTRPLSTRSMLVTGEALPAGLARRWHAQMPDIPLVNAYGPAECADDVSLHVLAAGDTCPATVPIGEPIANVRLYVVDTALRPTPPGSTGELCVGGVAVGRGYLGDPRATADRFRPDPFTTEPGARLYRTGDLVRRRADGAVEFVGRNDHQVKVRGHRIELGEVEAALLGLPGVRDAVARAGGDTLVAYVVLDDGPAGRDPAAVRAMLAERLPAYLVPSVLVPLDRLPRNPNGKVDRSALPTPTAVRASAPPSTPVECALHAIWSEVLGGDGGGDGGGGYGVDDDFFSVGGQSMRATQVRSRIHQRWGVRLPLRTLFEAPTLRLLAAAVTQAQVELIGELDVAELLARVGEMADHEVDAALCVLRDQS